MFQFLRGFETAAVISMIVVELGGYASAFMASTSRRLKLTSRTLLGSKGLEEEVEIPSG